MTKREISIGHIYMAKISNNVVPVRIDSESVYGGWIATNLSSGRQVRIKTAAKLRREADAYDMGVHWDQMAEERK